VEFFGASSPWSRSPFSPRLGQETGEPAIAEGESVSATGGRIQRRYGFLWFFPDEDARGMIHAATGKEPPESIEARVTMCNPTPGFAPVLGNFQDPATREWCFIDLPEAWRDAWRWGALAEYDLEVDYRGQGVPPYYGEWGALDRCGRVGPYDSIEEAFDGAAHAATENGATALPGDGWAQVKDSRGDSVGPIT
jgi:hypothetical protein